MEDKSVVDAASVGRSVNCVEVGFSSGVLVFEDMAAGPGKFF